MNLTRYHLDVWFSFICSLHLLRCRLLSGGLDQRDEEVVDFGGVPKVARRISQWISQWINQWINRARATAAGGA